MYIRVCTADSPSGGRLLCSPPNGVACAHIYARPTVYRERGGFPFISANVVASAAVGSARLYNTIPRIIYLCTLFTVVVVVVAVDVTAAAAAAAVVQRLLSVRFALTSYRQRSCERFLRNARADEN